MTSVNPKDVEEKFLKAVQHHIDGWNQKIRSDFSEEGYQNELSLLQSDPVYSKFALDSPEYVLVRLTGIPLPLTPCFTTQKSEAESDRSRVCVKFGGVGYKPLLSSDCETPGFRWQVAHIAS